MSKLLTKLRRAMWTVKQPLTKNPTTLGVTISDLFVWRNTEEWKTYFELIDIPSFFENVQPNTNSAVTICFFDSEGAEFRRVEVEPLKLQRLTLNLADYLSAQDGEFGTFSVFHSHTPGSVSRLGSFLAERGYLSYLYKDAPLRSYVHGNMDAITLNRGGNLEMLGGSSFLERSYNMQLEIVCGSRYELVIANATSNRQFIICEVMSAGGVDVTTKFEKELKPRGSHTFVVSSEDGESRRVRICSHMVMARPLVFKIGKQKMDVFHG